MENNNYVSGSLRSRRRCGVKILSRQREKAESTGPFQSRRVNVRSRQGKQARIKVFQNFIPNTCILCGVNRIFWGKKEVYSTGQMKLAEKETSKSTFLRDTYPRKARFQKLPFYRPKTRNFKCTRKMKNIQCSEGLQNSKNS